MSMKQTDCFLGRYRAALLFTVAALVFQGSEPLSMRAQSKQELSAQPGGVTVTAGRNAADGQLYAIAVDENGLLQTTASSGVFTLKIDSSSIGALSTLHLIGGPGVDVSPDSSGIATVKTTAVAVTDNATQAAVSAAPAAASAEVSQAQAAEIAIHSYVMSHGTSLMGDGSFAAAPQTVLDNTLGRNTGSGGNINLNNTVQERNAHAGMHTVTFATPGISEYDTRIIGKYSTGDFAVTREFLSPICSLTEVSGEGCKFHYTSYIGPTSYTATLSTILTAGSELMTTPLDNCGNAASDGYCYGSQRWLIDKTAAPAYAGTVTALTFPSDSAVGTMTLSGTPNLTPTVTATIPAGVPDTTDALNGDTIQVAITGATGTVPASGNACIDGPTSAEVDCVTYTSSGSTLTLSGHRWPHSNAKGAPTIFFAPPSTAVFAQDQSYYSSDIGYTVLGNASANSVYWTTQGGGSRSGANLQQFSTFYTASSSNGVTIYPSALVVTTEDPAKAGTVASHDGYMRLAANAMTLAVGDTLSETLLPITSMFDYDERLYPRQYAAANLAGHIIVNENIPNVYQIQLSNLHSKTIAGGGMLPLPTLFPVGVYGDPTKVGAFENFAYMPMAPHGSLLTWENCQGGPHAFDAGCTSDKQWAIYQNKGTGEGLFVNLNTTASLYNRTGRYYAEVSTNKYWDSPNGAAGLAWPSGLSIGVNGCPLTPQQNNGSRVVYIGTSGYFNAPCIVAAGGYDTKEDSAIASAATISPQTALFHITGTTTISTITPLPGMAAGIAAKGYGGCMDFITDSALTLAAGTGYGQFAATLTTTAAMLYHACLTPSTGLWYVK